MADAYASRVARFVAELEAVGALGDPAWRAAFAGVPRHVFLPRFFVDLPDGRWRAVDERDAEYAGLVYADSTLTTQLDGVAGPVPGAEPVAGIGTSSSTQPTLMAWMLDALGLRGGERVLEIGTGTGYNAALLAHRLGGERVTSVEVDPVVARMARERLEIAGYRPVTVVGDGERGWAARAPYDAVLATVAVPEVPAAWIEQARDGGVIVTSLWRDLGGGPLVRLVVDGDVAQGRFLAVPGGFMPVRSAPRAAAVLASARYQTGERRETPLDPSILRTSDAGLWIALFVPGATWLGFTPDGGAPQMWLFAVDGSWAVIEGSTVEQYGPRRLWDEAETVHARWSEAGGPTRERLGLTVCADGDHRFWLDDPGVAAI
ncbi:protein-L-isoaspartate(D-aspartate) O-methyltransferase [Catenuloplanes nepalensis]|uniref:Protein-L-isoaspartate O-methyltransferase n=1 Tax=Catenuloplanes nepalensis TaxID=587533 RepID=A0ABT9MTG3_9ACTN|nr:ATP-grasp peptide maturase system methyltransferase [Catenuloplanes nepalensis]MDP9794724.1 protein-L-isoaspartate(D-aspartate) O-methyltransferase [Catenuloplanes nepalensis]